MSPNNISTMVKNRHSGLLTVILITLVILPALAFANHRHFDDAVNWTGYAFYGDRGTFFADVTGDGKADAIAVNRDGIWFRRSNGLGFETGIEKLGPTYIANRGYFFADVTGDGKADAIGVLTSSRGHRILVQRSDDNYEVMINSKDTINRYHGDVGTFFANVDNNKTADLIAIDWIDKEKRQAKVTVRRSNGRGGFLSPEDWTWTDRFSPGTAQTLVADVTGDGKADLIAVNKGEEWEGEEVPKGVKVSEAFLLNLPSADPGRFFGAKDWTREPVRTFFGTLANGKQATFAANVNGVCGGRGDVPRADIIGVNDGTRIVGDNGIGVRESFGAGFATPDPASGFQISVCGDGAYRPWGYWTREGTNETFYGTRGTFFADVTGDGTADAIAVNDDGVWVRRSCAGNLAFAC